MATILVVDDRDEIRRLLVSLLGDRGHRLLEAPNGAEALKRLRTERTDLVISDVLMPIMDGYELLRQIRTDPALASIPVFFYSGNFQEPEARELALKCGVSGILTKPFDAHVLLQKVEDALCAGPKPATVATVPPQEIDREHLRLLTDTLTKKVQELETANQRLANLHRIDRAILEAQQPREIAEAVVCQLHRLIPAWHIGIWVFDFPSSSAEILAAEGGGFEHFPPGTVVPLEGIGLADIATLREGKDCEVIDVWQYAEMPPVIRTLEAAGLRSYIRIPLISTGELIGVLSLSSDQPGRFASGDLEIAHEVTAPLAIAIRHAVLFEEVRSGREQLQTLSRQLLRAQEEERRHIARELHDEIGQSLSALKLDLQRALQSDDAASALPYLEEAKSLNAIILRQVRDLSLDLRPSVLDDLGLVAALRWYVDRLFRRTGLVARFDADPPDARASAEIETACFRVVQEALTNVVRHARAGKVDVRLRTDKTRLWLTIRDDGDGFDLPAARRSAVQGMSLGLLGMRERVGLLGGCLKIETAPGKGTEVRIEFASSSSPWPADLAAEEVR